MTTRQNFAIRWSPAIERKGYVQVPNLLIEHIAVLDIKSTELVFLLCLLRHRQTKLNPFPSLSTIGRYSGKARNTMQGAARSLEKKGFIRRIPRGGNQTNEYDVMPLVNRLESYAHPIEKSIPTHRNTNNRTYRKFDTEEDALKKTKIRRRYGNSGKVTSIGDVLSNKPWS